MSLAVSGAGVVGVVSDVLLSRMDEELLVSATSLKRSNPTHRLTISCSVLLLFFFSLLRSAPAVLGLTIDPRLTR